MSYYQETTNIRDEEEVSNGETEEDYSCGEEARYNPSVPAYLQLPLGKSEILGRVRPSATRQQPNNCPPKKKKSAMSQKEKSEEMLLGRSALQNQYP